MHSIQFTIDLVSFLSPPANSSILSVMKKFPRDKKNRIEIRIMRCRRWWRRRRRRRGWRVRNN
jgi:hypothetical protein